MKESAKLVLLFQRKSTNVPLLQALFPIEVGGQWFSWATLPLRKLATLCLAWAPIAGLPYILGMKDKHLGN